MHEDACELLEGGHEYEARLPQTCLLHRSLWMSVSLRSEWCGSTPNICLYFSSRGPTHALLARVMVWQIMHTQSCVHSGRMHRHMHSVKTWSPTCLMAGFCLEHHVQ